MVFMKATVRTNLKIGVTMAKQGRYFRPKAKHLLGTKFDSDLEKRLYEGPLNTCEFHTEKVPYTISYSYNPDFIYRTEEAVFYIESKGFFQDASEIRKMVAVKDALPEGHYIVFVFERPDKPIHFQKKRKDNTKMTHKEFAEKHGFMWFDENNIHHLISGGLNQ